MKIPRPTMHLMCSVLLALASGCGYQHGASAPAGSAEAGGYQWRTLYRQDVQTIAVPIFRSTSFQRGVEFNLSKAIVNQVEANTPYKVVPRERADTVLEGEIVDAQVGTLGTDRETALPQEQMLAITVNFIWKDLRTGRVLVERRNFEQTATYYPTLGEGRATGTQHAVEKLALAIVQELQADW